MSNVESVFFGVSPGDAYDNGTQSSVAINAANRCVEAHRGEIENKLYFRVAAVSGVSLDFDSSKPASYTDGQNPSVALTRDNVVIEAHDDDGKIYYSVRTLAANSVSAAIQAAEFPNSVDSSSDPAVAVNGSGVVVVVHRAGNDLRWRIGQLGKTTGGQPSLTLYGGSNALQSNRSDPSVSINDSGRVVVVYQNGNDLYYRTGQTVAAAAGNNPTITFQAEPNSRYDTGINPSVAITADNWVFEVHESETIGNVYQRVGRLSDDGRSIDWKPFLGGDNASYLYDMGENPTVATNGKVAVQAHKSETRSSLFANASLVFDRAGWIHDNFRQLRDKTLRDLVLPGSHDAGQYREAIALQTQTLDLFGQLSAGVRWFDLRVTSSGGTIKVHHAGFVGVDFQDILDDVRRFMQAHNELVILKISHFLNFDANALDKTIKMIGDTDHGISPWLVTRDLGKRLGKAALRELIGPNVGAVLVVMDNKDDADQVRSFLDFDPRKPKNRGIRRYRDWYAPDPQDGDLTVFDIYSHTDNFDRMATGTQDDPDTVNAVRRDGSRLPVGQFPKFGLFDGVCRFQAPDKTNVPCDLFLLSWTLTIDGSSPVTLSREANKNLVDDSASHSRPNSSGQIINLLYTDVSQASRSSDVALVRNGLVS